jgi:hypothetical protein
MNGKSQPVKAWEDVNALVADDEGFAYTEHIIQHAPFYLHKTGVLLSFLLRVKCHNHRTQRADYARS